CTQGADSWSYGLLGYW
nr:immunoglobulin heavy chain junction region [Macaca mulatta]MOW82573.1 immunoglobulin heavy chain junction region [Macaca mulatta]